MFSPLADLMRPKRLDEFVGQEHLVGKGKILRELMAKERDNKISTFPSMIFWGPPGSGKTTLARIIANEVNGEFLQLSATMSGVNEIRAIIGKVKGDLSRSPLHKGRSNSFLIQEELVEVTAKKTIVFIDEIHRFNKVQQDSLLPHVEDGTITLIGATTENPSFEVNSALLSRTRVLALKPLEPEHIREIVERAMEIKKVKLSGESLAFLTQASNGDARIALNALELAASLRRGNPEEGDNQFQITIEHIKVALQNRSLIYDKGAEEHYNTISAFIKSMRASNPDAALYYLARMVEAGEDPKFIARRMVIFASEDVGMAQPTALVVANEVFKACETIGYPECQINLAHGAVYLTQAKKDRGSYDAYFKALEDVKKLGNLPIPLNLRNAPTKLMKDLGYGNGYEKYTKESLLPEELKGKKYYFG